MNYFVEIVRSIERKVTALAGLLIVLNVIIVVSNVIYRLFGSYVNGTYELVEITIGVAVAFALCHAAAMRAHIAMDVLLSRFSQWAQRILQSFWTIISIGYWGLIAWSSYRIFCERMITGEVTEQLKISMLPIRFIWILALFLCCLVLLADLLKSWTGGAEKNEPS